MLIAGTNISEQSPVHPLWVKRCQHPKTFLPKKGTAQSSTTLTRLYQTARNHVTKTQLNIQAVKSPNVSHYDF
jgi:hypothetical protein